MKLLLPILFLITACSNKIGLVSTIKYDLKKRITGTEFYNKAISFNWKQRDSFAVKEFLKGNHPDFFKQFVSVENTVLINGKKHVATFYVAPDYISIGTNKDWARVPLTPMAAQLIADSFNCFLPTVSLVNLIYKASDVKLQPQPLFIYRDSSITMWQHHLIIEGQRKNRKGLIAGIKKDIVLTPKMMDPKNLKKEAIYGWHKLDGKPIQPVYLGHANWYVDYSHGARLIYRKIKLNNQFIDYEILMRDATLKQIICDDDSCGFVKYSY